MYDGYQLQACSDDGYCRLFHTRSTLSGEGRLDIDLGADRELRVSVTDRATGDPIANAGVIVGANAKQKTETFHFADGEVIQVRDTHEPLGALTDATGVVKVRGLGAGPQRIAVVAEGYESLAKSITPIDHGQIDLKIELTSEEDTESDPEALTLRFEDRQPVPRAYFLSLTPDGRVDYPCSASTDHRGEVRLPEACLAQDSKRFFVLHPEARLAEFSAGQLRQSSEVFVRRNRAQPVYVRFVDAEGRPLVARPLDLRFGRLSLGPNHFLAAMSRTGLDIPFRTGSGGEIAIRLVEANGARPEVGLADSAGHDWFRIDGEPGQMVEVLVDE